MQSVWNFDAEKLEKRRGRLLEKLEAFAQERTEAEARRREAWIQEETERRRRIREEGNKEDAGKHPNGR